MFRKADVRSVTDLSLTVHTAVAGGQQRRGWASRISLGDYGEEVDAQRSYYR